MQPHRPPKRNIFSLPTASYIGTHTNTLHWRKPSLRTLPENPALTSYSRGRSRLLEKRVRNHGVAYSSGCSWY